LSKSKYRQQTLSPLAAVKPYQIGVQAYRYGVKKNDFKRVVAFIGIVSGFY